MRQRFGIALGRRDVEPERGDRRVVDRQLAAYDEPYAEFFRRLERSHHSVEPVAVGDTHRVVAELRRALDDRPRRRVGFIKSVFLVTALFVVIYSISANGISVFIFAFFPSAKYLLRADFTGTTVFSITFSNSPFGFIFRWVVSSGAAINIEANNCCPMASIKLSASRMGLVLSTIKMGWRYANSLADASQSAVLRSGL